MIFFVVFSTSNVQCAIISMTVVRIKACLSLVLCKEMDRQTYLEDCVDRSLAQGNVPDDLRQAHVAPVFKKGEKYDPANYRPVSLTCIC